MALGDSITTNLVERVVIGDTIAQIASTAYGECITEANNANKVVAMNGFVTTVGVTVHIRFINGNTASNPTLNINGSGGIAIVLYGTTPAGSEENIDGWPAGAVISFTLIQNNGTYYWVRDLSINTDTTYTIDQTYNGTSINPISGAGVKNALETLDVDNASSGNGNHITGFGAAKTLATLTETDGIIAATFQDITIPESAVTNLTDDLAEKAPKNNPEFTGVVKVPAITSFSGSDEAATKGYVDSITNGITSPTHYLGDATVTVTPGSGNNPPTISVTLPSTLPSGYTAQTGDIVSDASTNKEYLFNGSIWRELGDEGSYALKNKTDSAIKAASVNYTAQTLSNNAFNLLSVNTAGTLPTLQTQDVTVTSIDGVGQVTTASVDNGSLIIKIGTNTTKKTDQTFKAVKENGFNQGAMPTFNNPLHTVGITTGGATLSVDTSIRVVVP